jgi:tyrosyl-tRNA synthetase
LKKEEFIILDNAQFYENLNIIDFIRDIGIILRIKFIFFYLKEKLLFSTRFFNSIGKHFRMATLLRKDSVAERLKSEDGISFTEFSYQLLQAYDFQQLQAKHNCYLQLGGSDQWGNITNGVEYIKKVDFLL